MSLNMGYYSIAKFYKTLKFSWLCSIRQMQRKMGWFTLYSVALTTAVAHVDD